MMDRFINSLPCVSIHISSTLNRNVINVSSSVLTRFCSVLNLSIEVINEDRTAAISSADIPAGK